MTGETSFKGLWDATLGSGSAWLVDLSIALMCLSAAIIYAGILGDTATSLLRLVGHAPGRAVIIAALTVCALTPLSLLEDLSSLSFTSLLGVIAVLYTAAFIAYRALDGSYATPSAAGAAATAAGRLAASLPAHLTPTFARASRWGLDAKALILVSNLGLAYIAHCARPRSPPPLH